ncbi:hypothetical protein Zmor_018313 [Zophobas morio]|uniref:Uncharacterized protein n=1 Tax=Zophobas morio TaxID=2755281 RepID=A0AA38IA59_9CUCU|nr:hypothetical protein Zmor_018313 [Zophobas morio]
MFDSQKQLQLLDLSGNPLEQFSGEGLSSLSALILAETALTSFEEDLKHLKMEILNLSSSSLETVDFSRFPKVEKVYLSNNKIVSISNLESLDSSYITLDNNQIATITGTFNDVSFVTLNHNRLEAVPNTLFNDSASVRFIDLSSNLIATIEKDAFRNLSVLQILHLEHNNITEIHPKLFVDLFELKYLDLSHNNIQYLQFGIFNNLLQLKVLNITDNKLKSLHENGFLAVISLEEILFHNNQIEYLDVKTLFQYKGQLKKISLNNNAWDCEDLAETFTALINRSVVLDGLSEEGENFHGIACSSKKENFWEQSEMSKFFNDDFKNSKFFQYFEKDYKSTGFFKLLHDYKNGETRTEKLVSGDVSVASSTNTILVFSCCLQVMIVFLLLLKFFIKNRRYDARSNERNI